MERPNSPREATLYFYTKTWSKTERGKGILKLIVPITYEENDGTEKEAKRVTPTSAPFQEAEDGSVDNVLNEQT